MTTLGELVSMIQAVESKVTLTDRGQDLVDSVILEVGEARQILATEGAFGGMIERPGEAFRAECLERVAFSKTSQYKQEDSDSHADKA